MCARARVCVCVCVCVCVWSVKGYLGVGVVKWLSDEPDRRKERVWYGTRARLILVAQHIMIIYFLDSSQ